VANPNPSPETRLTSDTDIGRETRFTRGNDVGAQFEPGNDAAVKHGGRAAQVALQADRPFTGIARAHLADVLDRMGVNLDAIPDGLTRIRTENAARVITTAELLDAAAAGAIDDDNRELGARYLHDAAGLRIRVDPALRDLADRQANGPDVIDAAIASMQGDANG